MQLVQGFLSRRKEMWLPSQWLQKLPGSKARLVKTQDLADEAELVFGEEVRITTEG